MKNKKTELVFVPSNGTGVDIDSILQANLVSLRGRGLESEIQHDPDRIVASFEEDFPAKDGRCLLNAYIDDRLLDGMRLKSVTVIYRDAFMPKRCKSEMEMSDIFLNGEHDDLYRIGDTSKFLVPIITCLPSRRTVSIFLEVENGGYDYKNHCRKAVLAAGHRVERVVQAARAARQLIQAFRSNPANPGFIDRSIKELYAAIGRC